jgi:NADPH:quinone reductase-like Zn-dependent oxidoreductase
MQTLEPTGKHVGIKSQTMKVIRIHNYGGPEVLQYEDAPRPQPQAGELFIRVQAAGVNPIDWKVRAGYMKDHMPLSFPLILGSDVSGVVEDSNGASRFAKGDEVFAMATGAYAEYIAVHESLTAPKPKSLHHVHAAAVPLAALAAWHALIETAELEAGQRVLIHGGAGGVGHFAVQLAKWKGAHVIATASTKNHDLLRKLGADETIDYTVVKFETIARDLDVVLDTIGGETQERSWTVLKKSGILVSLVQPPSEEKAKAFGARGVMVMNHPDGNALAEIAKLIDAGKLTPVIDRILPLSEARRAHQLSESGHTHGKIVLRVRDEDGTSKRS